MRQLSLFLVAAVVAIGPGRIVPNPMASGVEPRPTALYAARDRAAFQGQSPARPVAGATIRGRVIDAADGKAIRGAEVSALPDFVPGMTIEIRTARTDDAGRFELTGVASGRLRISASRVGFVAERPGAWPEVDLQAGRTVDVQLRMRRGAAISGTLVDETGEPVPRARLSLMKVQ